MSVMNLDLGLHLEVSAALSREARLLDEARLEEWLDWLSQDIVYRMPTRFVRKASERQREFSTVESGVDFFHEDYESLRMRVQKARHRMSWSDNPASRTVHAVSNIEVEELGTDRYVVHSVVSVYRSRFANYDDVWPIRREDELVREEGELKLNRRTIFYPAPVLSSANLAVFF